MIVYLTTRHFGLRNFGTLYWGLLTALSLGTAFGPLAAAAVYDATGSYQPFLWLTVVSMLASATALASLPQAGLAASPAQAPARQLESVAHEEGL